MSRAGRVLCGIGCTALALLLAASAYNGIYEGLIAIRTAGTRGMLVASVTQLLYGGLGALALLALAVRRDWVAPLLVGWGITVTLTAGLAPVVYGGASLFTGIGTGVLTALIAWLTLTLWRIARLAGAQAQAS